MIVDIYMCIYMGLPQFKDEWSNWVPDGDAHLTNQQYL
jgi:hypothetical protein